MSAPLIIDPVTGPLVERLQVECKNFEAKFGIKVSVVMRAGRSVKRDAKAEPLRTVWLQEGRVRPLPEGWSFREEEEWRLQKEFNWVSNSV